MTLPVLTLNERHEAAQRLFLIIEKVKKGEKQKEDDRQFYVKLETKLSLELKARWKAEYAGALKEVFEYLPQELTQEAAELIERELLDALGPAFGTSAAVRRQMKKYIETAYSSAKREWTLETPKGKDSPLLSLPDRRAIEVLTRHNCFWLGEHYGEHVGPKISELTRSALDMGLGRKALAEELEKELGGVAPKDYKYWDVVSSAALVRARSFGTVSGMEEAGITEYEVLAMGDERMCPICGEMNGRVFSVAETRKVINSVLNLNDPKAFKEAMPWQTKPAKGVSNKTLCSSGQSVPPFHGRCRCTLVVVLESSGRDAIADAIGVVKGAPFDIEEAAKGANPNFITGGKEYSVNCQRCVPTYELRRRGYNVEALPELNIKEDKYSKYPSGPAEIYKNAQIMTPQGATSKKVTNSIEKQVLAWGNKARVQVVVVWKNKSAHTFIIENNNGKVELIDPQNETYGKLIDYMSKAKLYSKKMGSYSRFWRIDTLDFDESALSKICKARDENDSSRSIRDSKTSNREGGRG
jgi:SPP1 gp7 family putative phage head morphogenesis protein